MKWLVAIIAIEAIVEIIIESALFDNLRVRISKKHHLLEEFMLCGWCVSVWVAIFVYFIVDFGFWVVLIPLVIHRVSNYLHDTNSLIKRLGWKK